jgi:hypothetical protein
LVTNPAVNTAADFVELAGFIAALDPEVAVFLLPDTTDAELDANVPDLPTLTVSPAPARSEIGLGHDMLGEAAKLRSLARQESLPARHRDAVRLERGVLD